MHTNAFMSLAWIYDLYRIGQQSVLPGEGEGVLQELLAHIVTGFKAGTGSLSLTNQGESSLRIVAGVGLPQAALGSTVAFGERIIGWVAQQQQGLCLAGDIASDARFQNMVVRDPHRVPSVAMCWPLMLGGQVLGVISLNRSAEMPPFTEENLANATQMGNLIAIVIENIKLHSESQKRIAEINAAYEKLEHTQTQLLQSEKMASIGQLAAGVAHEINNPVGYVNSNLGTLQGYVNDLFQMLAVYEKSEALLAAEPTLKAEI
ncbi:MAG: GAF domain-containing protein, partial [Gammaproteobacteria bacterium]|nr:GAF domain-containing protein [Gammaproteobacteria bacterium]